MCIAILNKKSSILDDKTLTNCFNNNPDGAGFAYIDKNKKLTITKGIFSLDVFLDTYKSIKKDAISDILIHCRIGTSGLKDYDNTHPHKINNNLVLIHNGILNIKVPDNSLKSDTRLFIDTYLKNLTIEQLQDDKYIKLLSDFIGTNNKFIIMDKYGKTYIINKDKGITDINNNWYSNTSYQYQNYYSYYDYTSVKLSKKVKKQIQHNINNLTDKQFYKMGIYPMVNIETGTFYDESILDTGLIDNDALYYLDDVDSKLYDNYLWAMAEDNEFNYNYRY